MPEFDYVQVTLITLSQPDGVGCDHFEKQIRKPQTLRQMGISRKYEMLLLCCHKFAVSSLIKYKDYTHIYRTRQP